MLTNDFLLIIKEYQAHSYYCKERESLTPYNIVKWISSGIMTLDFIF